ncbi:hypothetical protein ABT255_43065 [Streptomyces mirabilis]|uniref:hypothetical protein n=1 Tax=Streptomyces mirabilis TaxID=68239 RepID=UPI00332F3B2E
MELGGGLDTVHAYLMDQVLREANEGGPVESSEEFGVTDPLASSSCVNWTPSSTTGSRRPAPTRTS